MTWSCSRHWFVEFELWYGVQSQSRYEFLYVWAGDICERDTTLATTFLFTNQTYSEFWEFYAHKICLQYRIDLRLPSQFRHHKTRVTDRSAKSWNNFPTDLSTIFHILDACPGSELETRCRRWRIVTLLLVTPESSRILGLIGSVENIDSNIEDRMFLILCILLVLHCYITITIIFTLPQKSFRLLDNW